ncbi:hypothetical protein D3C71_2192970 [compost metagenome]
MQHVKTGTRMVQAVAPRFHGIHQLCRPAYGPGSDRDQQGDEQSRLLQQLLVGKIHAP